MMDRRLHAHPAVRADRPGLLPALVFALPPLAAVGYAVPVIGLYSYYLAVGALIVGGLGRHALEPDGRRSPLARALGSFALVWVAAALVHLALRPGDSMQIKAAAVSTLGVATCVVLARLAPADPRIARAFTAGWLVILWVSIAVALGEIATGKHLSTYLSELDPLLVKQSFAPGAFFNNPNTFALFLVCASFFVLWRLEQAKRHVAVLLGTTYVASGLLIVTTGSRLCLVAFLVQSLVLLRRMDLSRLAPRVVAVGVVATCVALVASDTMIQAVLAVVPDKVSELSSSGLVSEVGGGAYTSGGRRLNLYLNVPYMLWESGGVGIGPSRFAVAVVSAPFDVGGNLNPHSVLSEIGVEYGIVPLAAFVVLVGRLAFQPSALVRAALLGAVFSGAAISGYLALGWGWLFLAGLLARTELLRRDEDPSPKSSANAVPRPV